MFDSVPLERSQVGPTRYAWRRFGDGPALLLIHGFPLSGYTWRKVLPELARHFTCYVPDLAGLGDTEWKAGTDFTWLGQARGLKDLVDALGLPKYHLMAHDTGGTVARCLALADAPRVGRMVLINTEIPHHRPQWIPQYQALLRLPGALAGFRLALRARAFRRSTFAFGGCFDDLSLIEGDFHDRFVAPLLRDPRRLRGLREYLVNLEWDLVDALAQDHARLAMPVKMIWGADDPFFPLAHARPMVRQFPRASMVEIPRARLFVHEERPAEVARAALEFLRAG